MTSGGKKSTYVDDVFSTYLYRGSSTSGSGPAQTITNGVDVAGEGGLVWLKSRTANNEHSLSDTVNGAGKRVQSQSNTTLDTTTASVSGFTNSGFTLPGGWNPSVNAGNQEYVSWTFRKASGFFDVVTYTGNGTAGRQIAHNLKCQPGRILIKPLSIAGNWQVNDYSIDRNGNLWGVFNGNSQYLGAGQYTGSTGPTSTHFTLGSANEVNQNGVTFAAYIFAGADRTGNASVEFQGENGYLKLKDSSDWSFTGEFSLEYWVYMTSNTVETPTITWGSGAWRAMFWNGSDNWRFQFPTGNSNFNMGGTAPLNTWKHHVLTRDSSNVFRFFIDGELIYNTTESNNMSPAEQLFLGYKANNPSNGLKNGKLSNVRLVKGSVPTGYQTSSTTNGTSVFTSPTAPLTLTSQGATESNVKLLCCNDIGASQATFISDSPGFSNYGKVGALGSKESPFGATTDKSAVFGEGGDEPIIRMGQYMGSNSSTNGNKVDVGFEPDYVMYKSSGGTGNWIISDSMRGAPNGADGKILAANNLDPEAEQAYLTITNTGFMLPNTFSFANDNEAGYVYMAIRRSDGYVGKPVEAASEVFAMDVGNSSNDIPAMDSNFVVDMGLYKKPGTAYSWHLPTRLTGTKQVYTNSPAAETNDTDLVFYSMVGWAKGSTFGSDQQSWMWKRHAGFDVVCYQGDQTSGRNISHSMNKIPEMMWVKNRSVGSENWCVYHKDVAMATGGTDSATDYLVLNGINGYGDGSGIWNDTAPTAKHFTVGNHSMVNHSGHNILAILFSSVDGISKCGGYTGTGSTLTITTGFSPKFLIIKRTDADNDWYVLDTLRGWTSGVDQAIKLNVNQSQFNSHDLGDPTSTGFTVADTNEGWNTNGGTYIYYAHA